MSETVLLRFLSNGLIDVGGDDAKLAKLQGTAAEVAVLLKKHPAKTPNYSLIAFDPQAPPTDPVILEVLEVLKKQWPTYVNTFASTPVGVLRSLILDALVEASHDDDRIAVAFVACARNVLPFMETGNEQSIWADVVQKIEADVDHRAEQEWATPANISIGQLDLQSPAQLKINSTSAKVDKDTLLAKLKDGAGGGGSNPYWPQNNPAAWSQTLSTQFAEAISEAIDNAVSKNKVASIDLSATMQQVTSAVSGYIGEVVRSVDGATAGLQRRTNLIWWKQALFSPSTQKSYRSFEPTTAAALMALDLYRQIPMFSPASVSAFLEEAVRSLQNSVPNNGRLLKDLLRETTENSSLAPLRTEAANLYQSPSGRCPISALIGHPEKIIGLSNDALRNLIGIETETPLTDAQWASWIFRDLQAGRSTKEQAKRRNGKGTA
jgi:hypothetical protein